MIDNNTRDEIEVALFRMKDFEGMWLELKNMYEYLGFTDELTDEQRISEFKWITQQLRKYISTKQDKVLSCETIEDMVAVVENYIANAEEYGSTRPMVVYNFMRDHWLYEVHDGLVNFFMNYEEEDE